MHTISVFHSPHSLLHDPSHEILAGEKTKYYESPERVKIILDALFPPAAPASTETSTGVADVSSPSSASNTPSPRGRGRGRGPRGRGRGRGGRGGHSSPAAATARTEATTRKSRFVEHKLDFDSFDKGPLPFRRALESVHGQPYREFLWAGWHAWKEEQPPNSTARTMLPDAFFHKELVLKGDDFRVTSLFEDTLAALGRYSFDLSAPLVEHTYEAVLASARVAYEAAVYLTGSKDKGTFALCRPPGHHAGPNLCGGYCYYNNAAIAAKYLNGATLNGKISILDVDYHHGNGTSKIFYEDPQVQYVSLHGSTDYPYFTGDPSEVGSGEGKGANVNWPVGRGATTQQYLAALDDAIKDVSKHEPLYLIVSLGVDTYKDDPLTDFQVGMDAYRKMGEKIAGLCVPTLFVMEGGYCLEKLGQCVRDVLLGFVKYDDDDSDDESSDSDHDEFVNAFSTGLAMI